MSIHILRTIAGSIQNFEAYALREYGLKSYEEAGFFLPPGFDADALVWNMLRELKDLGPGYEELVVDVGLMQYLSEFRSFVASRPGLSPWTARELFAQTPENQTKVYRGMRLNDHEAELIQRVGIQCGVARASQDTSIDLLQAGSDRLRKLVKHTQRSTQESIFVSVTSYPEVATGIARRYGQEGSDRSIRLYEILISKIDLLRRSYVGDQGLWQKFVPSRSAGLELKSQGSTRVVSFTHHIEQFALWEIPATQFKEVVPPANAGFTWLKNLE